MIMIMIIIIIMIIIKIKAILYISLTNMAISGRVAKNMAIQKRIAILSIRFCEIRIPGPKKEGSLRRPKLAVP